MATVFRGKVAADIQGGAVPFPDWYMLPFSPVHYEFSYII